MAQNVMGEIHNADCGLSLRCNLHQASLQTDVSDAQQNN
jgi:hypothetical protein